MFSIDQLRIFTEPQQGATYDDLLAVARRAEQLGFGAFFRSDHYLAMGGALEAGGLPGPTDAWTTLAGLARDTSTIRLGTLVTSATFRLPGPLAITVAGVDQMSGGRVELGLGAGWYEHEHSAYGIPFPPLGERFDRLEEQLAVITGLWSTPAGETFAFDGAHYRSPTRRRCPSRCRTAACRSSSAAAGRSGRRRSPPASPPSTTRRSCPIERFVEQRGRVVAACEAIDRDPASLHVLGRRGRVRRRRRGRVRAAGRGDRAASPTSCARNGVAGTPDEVAATLRALGRRRRRAALPPGARPRRPRSPRRRSRDELVSCIRSRRRQPPSDLSDLWQQSEAAKAR